VGFGKKGFSFFLLCSVDQMSTYSFFIIGKRDNPLYEYTPSQKASVHLICTVVLSLALMKRMMQKEDLNVLQQNQFFVHAALDIVEEELWKTNSTYVGSSSPV
jgi:hypothetical protein